MPEDKYKFFWDGVIAIVAVIALVQPWLFAAYKRYLRPGKLELYHAKIVEVSYGLYGPSIGLTTTFRAINHDLFIEKARVKIVRGKDEAKHNLDWLAFKPPQIDLSMQGQQIVEVATGFMVTVGAPKKLTIFFNDAIILEEINQVYQKYQNDFHSDVFAPTERSASAENVPTISDEQTKSSLKENALKFLSGTSAVNAHTLIRDKCYWNPDSYALAVEIQISNNKKRSLHNYKFSINQEQSELLKRNAVTIIDYPISSLLKRDQLPLNSVNVALESTN